MIERVQKTLLSNKPALVPTGSLLEHHLVPLTGEIRYGIGSNGINITHLSGMGFFNSHFNVCMEYANKESFIFNPEYELEYIMSWDPDSHNPLNNGKNRLKIAVLRLILMNEKVESWDEIKNYLETKMSPKNEEELSKILNLFTIVKPLNLSEESLSLITHSFPVIWGSTSIEPEGFKFGVEGERIVSGVQKLGDDIQVIFADSDHTEVLKDAIGKYGVTVLSFDAAKYILNFSNFQCDPWLS